MKEFPGLQDDGLMVEEIGTWAIDKYRLVTFYASLFAKSMRKKWDQLVYVDLFSGPGRSIIEGTTKIIDATPLQVLALPEKFDKYIFCEVDREKHAALKKRIEKDYGRLDVQVLLGNSNEITNDIINCMPPLVKGSTMLTFCFVDPYNVANLNFKTIEKLATRYMDFLVLLPSGMDANRALVYYRSPENTVVEKFTGDHSWREKWEREEQLGKSFEMFFTNLFGQSMARLGYIAPGLEDTAQIFLPVKKVLLYRLALYSRAKLGVAFWKQAKKYTNEQTDLFE